MSSRKSKKSSGEIATNKQAYHNYEILESYEAGLVLQGTEVKSAREKGVSLKESYIKIFKGEAWLIGCHIALYKFGNIHNHKEVYDRKLLLHRYELKKLKALVQEKGLTLVPLSMYLKEGKIKVKIGIARGKKLHDKRADSKERDQKRDINRTLKGM